MLEHAVSPGDVIAGAYRIDARIGEGAMGSVFSAADEDSGERVAVKVLHSRHLREPQHLARFVREAKVAARLESAHAVRVFEVGMLDEGVPFFVMELLKGVDLWRHVKSVGPLPISRAIDYILQACEAVSEAHGQGVVHRDLKPANLFLARGDDGDETIKVIDFGVSKLLRPMDGGDEVTATTVVVGTPAFMAPEQMRSSDVDARADVWALGVTLYYLVTGERPFRGDSIVKIYENILRGPQPIAELRPDAPAALAAIVDDTLVWDPDGRLGSVEELRDRLQALVDGGSAPVSRAAPTIDDEATFVMATGEGEPALVLDSPPQPAPVAPRRYVAPIGIAIAAAALAAGGYFLGSSQRAPDVQHALSPAKLRVPQSIQGRVAASAAGGPSASVVGPVVRPPGSPVPRPVPRAAGKPALAPPKKRKGGDDVWGMP